MALAADTAGRVRLHRALERRNRVVGALRWLVPAAGLVLVAVLLGRMALAGLTDGFSIERIAVTPEAVTVTGPQLAGTLEDGARFSVAADWAQTRFDTPDRMELGVARLTIERPQGPAMTVTAAAALIETGAGIVHVEGPAQMVDASGTQAALERSRFDWGAELLESAGPVSIDYADGTRLEAGALRYDAKSAVWTFTGVRLTLPDTPGAAPAP